MQAPSTINRPAQSEDRKSPAEQRAALRAMTPQERHDAYRRGELTPVQLWSWASQFPYEPPLIDGELEWIARDTPEVAEADEIELERRAPRRPAESADPKRETEGANAPDAVAA